MSLHVATLYGVNLAVLASATDWPTSTTSGARLVPSNALTSSWLLPFGLMELIVMLYLAENALMIAP